jgi:hypothetical protein
VFHVEHFDQTPLAMVVPIVVFIAIVMLVAIVVIVPAVAVSVVVSIPVVIVLKTPAISVPIAGEVTLSVMARRYPAGAHVRRASPVAAVPPVVLSYRIPITLHPHEIRSRGRRNYGQHAGRRRRADLDSDRDLSSRHPAEQENSGQQAWPNEIRHKI